MGVDTHVAGCSGQRLSLTIGDMLLGFRITILLSHTKVNDVDHIGGLRAGATDEEVVGLDVTIDEILLMDCLDARKL